MKALNLEIQKRFNGKQFIYVVVDRLPPQKDKGNIISKLIDVPQGMLSHYEKYEECIKPQIRNVPPNVLHDYTNYDILKIKLKIKELNGRLGVEEKIDKFNNHVYIYFLSKENVTEFIEWCNSLIVLSKIAGI